jgi:hypothetical protein
MHHTSSSDRRQALQKEAHELARDARALLKAAHAPGLSPGGAQMLHGRETILAEAEAFKLQAGLMAQIYLEDGHVSSGLRAYSALA